METLGDVRSCAEAVRPQGLQSAHHPQIDPALCAALPERHCQAFRQRPTKARQGLGGRDRGTTEPGNDAGPGDAVNEVNKLALIVDITLRVMQSSRGA